ncbi:MAG TPA: Ig-like domain-containing protein [Steroidobacteraceae bacterium]|nr:Ig-like domain-containing protein [Steroidobacteraceae bacterium]
MLWTRKKAVLLLITLCALGSNSIVLAASLELINSNPADNTTNVSRTDTLTLQFSASLVARSVRSDTVTLASPAGTQSVSLTITDATVSLHPVTPLLPWTNYTLNVTSVMGRGGEQLAAPVTLHFKTRDASWQMFPSRIDRLTSQWSPVTATNAKGIRFVAWLQSNEWGTGDDIWAVRHMPGTTSSAVRIASFPQDEYVTELNVFVDEDGNAFATWVIQKTPVTYPPAWHQWANRFVTGSGPGSGWGTAQIIDGYSTRSATNLHLVFDHAGNAVALWQEFICCGYHSPQSIVTTRYTRAAGWGHPIHLDDNSFFVNGPIDIQLDNAGDAYATWSTLEDLHYPVPKLFVSYYKATSGGFVWTPEQLIATQSTMNSTGAHALAVNPRGDAMLMWADDSGLKYARTDAAGRWSAPIVIDPSVTTSPSQVVLLDNGQAFAAFVNGVKTFMPNNGWWSWTHPLLVNQNASSDPRVVVDLNGNALVAWTQSVDGVNRVYTKRYLVNRGWFGAAPIDSQFTLGGRLQELFLEPSGSVVATWLENNSSGDLDVMTSRFE